MAAHFALKHIRGFGRDPSVAADGDLFRLFVHVDLECGKAIRRRCHSSTLQLALHAFEMQPPCHSEEREGMAALNVQIKQLSAFTFRIGRRWPGPDPETIVYG